jgi:hypothetical protein
MNRKERKEAAERFAAEIIVPAKERGSENGSSEPHIMTNPH